MAVEASFKRHIRPLFRAFDIEKMSSAPFGAFDLTDVEAVRSRAERIYQKLTNEIAGMPCDGPWPDEWITLFRRWIDEGTKD